MFGLLRRARRKRLMAMPFPREWERWLDLNCGFYPRLPTADRDELRQRMQVFLAEKVFEGCAGLEITDEIRVTIAAHACLLLLHRRTDYYPYLGTILVYPGTFVAEHVEVDELGIEWREKLENAGESWDRGNIILAWDVARHGAIDPRDGLNVLLHEWAHQLDAENGEAEGAPVFATKAERDHWARVMGVEYERHVAKVDADQETLLDPYGATDPAEFFAVCVETFFELGPELKAEHPELYRLLSTWFQQDPASWPG
jgi:MtfA peptidase